MRACSFYSLKLLSIMDGATNFYKICLLPKRTLYHKLVRSNANQLFFFFLIENI